jgi:hypothetical protein
VLPVTNKLRIVFNTLIFLALCIFALQPDAVKDYRAAANEAVRLPRIVKTPASAVILGHGKLEYRKAQGFPIPDLSWVPTHDVAPKPRRQVGSTTLCADASFARLTLRSSLGRAPPAV